MPARNTGPLPPRAGNPARITIAVVIFVICAIVWLLGHRRGL